MALTKDFKFTLNNGLQIPITGFGVFQTPPDVTLNIVYEALKIGYRHIDSARYYENEKEVADGISKFLKEFPDVKRSDIFFTSKLFNLEDVSREHIVFQVEESLERVKVLGYIDLYLLHSPFPNKDMRFLQYDVLQDFVDAGKIKSIGVSNWNVRHMDELFAWDGLRVKPVVNQVELHPWLPRKEFQECAKKYNYYLEAYTPLTQGKKFNDPELQSIAKKHGKSPAEILLRWSYDQGFIPLAKSVTVERVKQNYSILDHVELDEDDKKLLDKPDAYEALSGWDPTPFEN